MGTQRIVDTAFATKASILLAVPGYALPHCAWRFAAEKYLDHVRLLLTGGDRLPKPFREKILEILSEMSARSRPFQLRMGLPKSQWRRLNAPTARR